MLPDGELLLFADQLATITGCPVHLERVTLIRPVVTLGGRTALTEAEATVALALSVKRERLVDALNRLREQWIGAEQRVNQWRQAPALRSLDNRGAGADGQAAVVTKLPLARYGGQASAPVVALPADPRPNPRNLAEARENERERILGALAANNWHRGNAAVALGIPRRTFYRRLVEYGLLEKK